MSTSPIPCVWVGNAFVPEPGHLRRASEAYGAGEAVILAEWFDRSDKTHKHEFAFLREAWKNLPESIADDFPTPEHLRKRLLIDCGFYHETVIDAGSNAAALRVAAYLGSKDTLSRVVVRGLLVVERTAKSQARGKMAPAEFQASKTAILEAAANLLGTTPQMLQTARAA